MQQLHGLLPALFLTFPVMAAALPDFSLSDPADIVHTQRSLLERGAVVIVSIPNVKHGSVQSRYAGHLMKSLPEDGPRLVIVEDLSQSNVRGMALRSMKSKYKPGTSTLLLLDHEGSLRRALWVPRDETAVLIFDRKGRLVQRVTGLMGGDEVIDATKRLSETAHVMASNDKPKGLPTVAEK